MEQNKFSINESIRFGWETFKNHAGYFLIVMVILFGVSAIFGGIEDLLEDSNFVGFISLLSYLVNVIIGMALVKIILEFLDGNAKPNWERVSSSSSLFWKYLGGTLLVSIIVIIGFILLIIPGIYFAIRFQFVSYLIIDKGLSPLDALRESTAMTQGIKFDLLLLVIAFFGINLLGVLALGVGLLVSIPVTMIAMGHVYRKILGHTPILPVKAEVNIGEAVPTDPMEEDLLE